MEKPKNCFRSKFCDLFSFFFLPSSICKLSLFTCIFISSDITKGKESSPIQCVNGFDDEQPPEDYIYITENCFTSPLHVQQTINTLQVIKKRRHKRISVWTCWNNFVVLNKYFQYCQCSGDCSSHNCKCSTLSFRCWYDDEGKLVPEFNFAGDFFHWWARFCFIGHWSNTWLICRSPYVVRMQSSVPMPPFFMQQSTGTARYHSSTGPIPNWK